MALPQGAHTHRDIWQHLDKEGSTTVKFLSARRRNPLVALFLLVAALGMTGVGYSVISNAKPAEAAMGSQTQVEDGKKLYLEGCSSCHGLDAQGTMNGPTLLGVDRKSVV